MKKNNFGFRIMVDMLDIVQIVFAVLLIAINIVNLGLAAASVQDARSIYHNARYVPMRTAG